MKIPQIQFPTAFSEIWNRVENIDPYKYAKTRNFIWGSVTYLSPYISRGVISVEDVRKVVLSKVDSPWDIEKFLQELAWREYWQRIWLDQGDAIFQSMRNSQERLNTSLPLGVSPSAVLEANTGISAIDLGITHLQESGYMHNHIRMYLACIWCNIGGYAWQDGAKWMYYHLLDGDLASNWLSWQWVCGTNSSKLYYCNQENINKYCGTKDEGTFLDWGYDRLSANRNTPQELSAFTEFSYPKHPEFGDVSVIYSCDGLDFVEGTDVFVFHSYHLDPRWMSEEVGEKIFVIEPSYWKKFPVSERVFAFILGLASEIPGIRVLYCEFSDISSTYPGVKFITKEHPTVNHWNAKFTPRNWMSSVSTATGSFFNFWKKSSREIMTKNF